MSRTTAVHIIGTGMIGTSIGLALSRAGLAVTLDDLSPTSAALARDLGAGRLSPDPRPDLVIVATPPDVAAATAARALADFPDAYATDVASVKGAIVADLERCGADLTRYCGSHPMAGRERSGAVSGRSDLFDGRAWVVTPTAHTRPEALQLVSDIARTTGAAVRVLDPGAHDAAVASVSHVPQVAASLVAARLSALPDDAVALAGQGLRDVTRIAGSEPGLWTQILVGNADAVRAVLIGLRSDLDEVIGALSAVSGDSDAPGARAVLAQTIAAGNEGYARIPGKHGNAPTAYTTVRVLIPDEPGQLGRLFAEIGETGTNIEEFHLDHSLGTAFGLAEIEVVPAAAAPLAEALTARGWRLHA